MKSWIRRHGLEIGMTTIGALMGLALFNLLLKDWYINTFILNVPPVLQLFALLCFLVVFLSVGYFIRVVLGRE